mmetsp:Transcript_15173/g.22819  ORF Transcript_15173/g.22819 Transcript_15173/m.22819 type:complete len:210 (+) Transcript_15173:515-1144(+)
MTHRKIWRGVLTQGLHVCFDFIVLEVYWRKIDTLPDVSKIILAAVEVQHTPLNHGIRFREARANYFYVSEALVPYYPTSSQILQSLSYTAFHIFHFHPLPLFDSCSTFHNAAQDGDGMGACRRSYLCDLCQCRSNGARVILWPVYIFITVTEIVFLLPGVLQNRHMHVALDKGTSRHRICAIYSEERYGLLSMRYHEVESTDVQRRLRD